MTAGRAELSASGRIAVGVSGSGSNLRALAAVAARGALGGEIALVFADRPCRGARLGGGAGDRDRRSCPAATTRSSRRRWPPSRRTPSCSRATCGSSGRRCCARFDGRILNVHPSLLPAFPGLHAVRDALAAGVAVTGVTVHLVDATLDGGPVVAQEPVPVLPDDDEATLLERLHAAEHRLLPAAVAALLAGALSVQPGARRVSLRCGGLRRARAGAAPGAAVGLRQDGPRGVWCRARRAGLRARQHRGDGQDAAGRRPAGHRRRRGHRLPRDARRPRQDARSARPRGPARRPPPRRPSRGDRRGRHRPVRARRGQPLPVRGGRAQARHRVRRPGRGDRHRRAVDGPGGGEEPCLGRDRDDAGRATTRSSRRSTSTARSPSGCAPRSPSRRSRTPPPTTPGSPPSCRAGCATRASTCPPEPGLPGAADPYPPVLTISMAKVDTLRYGENPHQPAARYRRTDREPRAAEGPFASGEPPLQGKALSYNNVLDASAAAALARLLRGPGVVIVKHTNPCGAAERGTLLEAWDAALAGDPVSAFGGVVGVTGTVDAALAERLVSIFLEVVVAPGVRRRRARGPRGQAQPAPRRGPRRSTRRRTARGAPGAACSTSTGSARCGPPAAPCS